MRIKRSLGQTCANYLLKTLAVAYVLTRKSTLTTLLKLKFSLSPLYRKDWGCHSLGFQSPPARSTARGCIGIQGWARCSHRVAEGSSGAIQAWSVQFHLFHINSFCLLEVFWSLGACDRTAEQLISRSSPRVRPPIRSQYNRYAIRAQTANICLVNEIWCCQKLFTDLIQGQNSSVSACKQKFFSYNEAMFLSLRN